MVKAFLDGDEVRLTAEATDIPTIKRLRSASRTNRMPPLTWVMPLTFDSVEELRREISTHAPRTGSDFNPARTSQRQN